MIITHDELCMHIVTLSMQLQRSNDAMRYWADRCDEKTARIDELERMAQKYEDPRIAPGTPDERD